MLSQEQNISKRQNVKIYLIVIRIHHGKVQDYIMERYKITSWEGTRLHHGKVQGDIIISHSYNIRSWKGACMVTRISARLHHGKVQDYIMERYKVTS